MKTARWNGIAPWVLLAAIPLRIAMHAHVAHREAGPPPRAPWVAASPAFGALIGLSPGDALLDWRVATLAQRGRSDVVRLTRDRDVAELVVARRGTMPWPAPRETLYYAVFFSNARTDVGPLVEALGARIAAREHRVPVPGEL